MATKRMKFERTTQEQLQFYLSFYQNHPQLQYRKNSAHTPSAIHELWRELVDHLNAMRGPTRTVAKWKESLSHWQNQLRSRARKARRQTTAVGADASDYQPLAWAGAPSLGLEEAAINAPECSSEMYCPLAASVNLGLEGEKMDDLMEYAVLPDVPAVGLQDTGSNPDATAMNGANIKLEFCNESYSTSYPVVDTAQEYITDESVSSPETAATPGHAGHSPRRKRVDRRTLYQLMAESITKREKREVFEMEQQKETTAVLQQLNQSLLALNKTLAKLNDKIDQLQPLGDTLRCSSGR